MWSKHNPRLQKTWDATSLRALMQCPRKYFYSIVEGWRTQEDSPHLTFGSLFQLGVEVFQLGRLHGLSIEDAGREALKRVLQESGEYVPEKGGYAWREYTWHPWGGDYVRQWRCTGTEPYKNAKGNRAKCPYSHAGKWFDDSVDARWGCPSCGSDVEEVERYVSEHPTKNRPTLIRTLCTFFEDQHPRDGLQPYAFPDGTPSVELQAVVPLERKTPGNEDYIGVANLDEINTWRGAAFITDNKTTSRSLSKYWFQGFSPDVQFDFYDLVASIFMAQKHLPPIAGLAVRGVQVTQEDSRIDLALITKTEGQREEFWEELHWWLAQAERYAADDYWPMNRASCERCQFRSICDTDPAFREGHLAERFERRPWHPIHRNNPQKEKSDGETAV